MVGLHLLKHVFNLSDEVVCARWVENPYYQHLCGFDYFQHELPVDRSSMTRWRERIGPGGMEVLLQATIAAGLDGGVVAAKELERVTVDTTVQPKAVTHPSDARLYHRGREILVRQRGSAAASKPGNTGHGLRCEIRMNRPLSA